MRLYEELIYLEEELEGHKAKRAEFLKGKIAEKGIDIPGFPSVDDFLEKVADTDPTKKGIYMQWIVVRILKDPEINRPEDLDRLKGDLVLFEKNKAQIEKKDINAYKTFNELYQAIAPFTKKSKPTSKEKQAQRLEALRNDIEVVHNSKDGWIRIPKTRAAAQFLGQNTRWCTASKKDNSYFTYYNKDDPLFVIYDKVSKDRYQLHIFTKQFADVTDQNIGLNAVPMWARGPLLDWYRKNKQEVGFKQVMTLAGLTSVDSVRDMVSGAQSDLLSLMDEYGI